MSVMMHILISYILIFSVFIITYKKYDDVGFVILKRKLTPSEALQRIVYVVSKCLASTNGGGLCAVNLYLLFIRGKLLITLDETGFFFLQLIMIAFFFGVIGILQNLIRRAQGRQLRPIIDTAIIEFNVQKWSRRR